MKTNQTLMTLKRKAKSGHFVAFDYVKSETGEKSHRLIRIGVDIKKSLERQGQPLKGKEGRGNWISGLKSEGKNGFLLRRGKEVFIRGSEVSKDGCKHKLFKLSGISNLK